MNSHMICKDSHNHTLEMVRQMYLKTLRMLADHEKSLKVLIDAHTDQADEISSAYAIACEKDAIMELEKRSEVLLECMNGLENLQY